MINCLVNMYLQASCKASTLTQTIWLWRAWAISSRSWLKRSGRALSLLKMPNPVGGGGRWGASSSVQNPSQTEWGKTLDAMRTALVLEKSLNLVLLDLHAPGFCPCKPPSVWLPGEPFPDKEVKVTQRMVTIWLTAGWLALQAGLGEYFFQKLPLKHN